MKRTVCIIFSLILVASSVIYAFADVEKRELSALQASDGKIINEEGEQVILRGTNLSGWLVFEELRILRMLTQSC